MARFQVRGQSGVRGKEDFSSVRGQVGRLGGVTGRGSRARRQKSEDHTQSGRMWLTEAEIRTG